jgi:Fe-S-cluster containining protein
MLKRNKLSISISELQNFRKEFNTIIEKNKPVCKIQCSACCKHYISVFSFEIIHLKNAIKRLKPNTKKIIEEKYQIQINHFLNNIPQKDPIDYEEIMRSSYTQQYGEDQIECPLLINGKCAIYNDRPFVCQLHFVQENPELCLQEPNRNACDKASELQIKFVQFLMSTGDFHLFPFPLLFKDLFDKKRKVPKISFKLK